MKILRSVTLLMLLPVIFFVIFPVIGPVIGARAGEQEVTFSAADGFTLKGTFYAAVKPGPGLLLLHACSGDRHIYDHLATMLNTAGYNVLAFDFRGFGGSRDGEYTDFFSQLRKIIDRMPGDVDAALNYLTSQSTVNPRALGIVASDCAVNEAVHAGQRHEAIRTLVLLSGDTDAEGEAYIKASPKVPILGVASEEAISAAAATKKLVALSANRDSQVETVTNAGPAWILAKQPDLEPDIVIWFISNLPLAGYGLPPAIK